MNPLPEKAKSGLTWRRLRNALRAPSLLWRNARFLWNDETSSSEHIFVVGPPRSGTTLVKNVLQSHSAVCGVEGETGFFLRWDYAGFRHSSVPDETMERLIRESRSAIELFERLATTIKGKTGGAHFLEKTPNHALRMDYITEHFPNSKIVFVVRDPRDGVRSAREHPVIWSTFPDEDRLGGYMEVWRRSVQAHLRHAKRDSALLVRYEDFCRCPWKCLQGLSEAIGIEVQDHQLDPSAYGDTPASESQTHFRLREPITPESVGAWRDELTEKEVRRVERTLVEEMQAFGYSLQYRDAA
jgi:hypothetical protein